MRRGEKTWRKRDKEGRGTNGKIEPDNDDDDNKEKELKKYEER
jgi:hypothetical protein